MLKLFIIGLAFTVYATEDGPIVNTNYGKIKGFVSKSTKDKYFSTFHNIPFAKPPTGTLRFMDPEQPESWEGVRDGVKPHSICSQAMYYLYITNQTKVHGGQEDCLYLSVYTPKVDGKLLPVMFFIHGGGFMTGAGRHYDGGDLINEDVILVSINYRLGVLGFISSEDGIIPGNIGLKDQTMALKWVHDNIKYFGGDPSLVTIFGESAGGVSVNFHILSPFSKGLFSRAILQSGHVLCPWAQSYGQRGLALQLGAAVDCFTVSEVGEQQSRRLLKCLQDIDDETLTMTFNKFMVWSWLPLNLSPYVDGNFVPNDPEILTREGKHHSVDMMIGVTKHEGGVVTSSLFSPNDYYEKLQNNFEYYGPISLGLSYEDNSAELSRKVYHHYLNKTTVAIEDIEALTEMYGDRHFKMSTNTIAQMYAENVKESHKVYMYEFDYRGKHTYTDIYDTDFGKHWVNHADDLIYMFPIKGLGIFKDQTLKDKDRKMKNIMTKLWANFAKTGNPTPDDSLDFKWDPFSKNSQKYLAITLQPEMKESIRTKIDEFWSSLQIKENKMLSGQTKIRKSEF